MAKNSKRQASALARKIDGDPRAAGRYDAHGVSEDAQGWYVCVFDSFGTRKHREGRDLQVRSWDEWVQALKDR